MNMHDRLLADYFRWVDHVGLQQAIELPGERFTLASVHRAGGKRRKKGWFTSNGASSAKNGGGGGVATPRIERERERDLAEKKKNKGKRVAATLERSDSAVSARLEETDGAMSDDALENANLSARLHRALLFLLIWGEAANVRWDASRTGRLTHSPTHHSSRPSSLGRYATRPSASAFSSTAPRTLCCSLGRTQGSGRAAYCSRSSRPRRRWRAAPAARGCRSGAMIS